MHKTSYTNIKKNSYYDIQKPYTQKEKDEIRIQEGISKQIKDFPIETMDDDVK